MSVMSDSRLASVGPDALVLPELPLQSLPRR
jgi:hypothetical protein